MTFAEEQALLTEAYRGFNAREIERVLGLMDADVNWPDVTNHVRLHGRDEVRAYWTRQWAMADPRVEPEGFEKLPSGEIAVSVHQVVRDLEGKLLGDGMVKHLYTIENGLIRHMAVE